LPKIDFLTHFVAWYWINISFAYLYLVIMQHRNPLEGVRINFDEGALLVLNISIAFIMFGVALGLRRENFNEVVRNPRGIFTGVVSQFLLLPAVTFLLVWLLRPLPGIALGMILVAACPGGNVSNFFSSIGRGNVALSVSLTAIATLLATVMTPLNFEVWGSILPYTSAMLKTISIDYMELFQTVVMILALPLMLGIWFSSKFPKVTKAIIKPIRWVSMLILLAIIGLAFYNNFDLFLKYFHYLFFIVLLHNLAALLTGYFFSRTMKNTPDDVRSVTIETGIQNSALGLIIIFTFFGGEGSMAIIAAWWGIWHIISGFVVARLFAWRLSLIKVQNN
jgi:bile acid:Na+ symporter, BASS family